MTRCTTNSCLLLVALIVSSSAFHNVRPFRPETKYPRTCCATASVWVSRTKALHETNEEEPTKAASSGQVEQPEKVVRPIILNAFPGAADPLYATTGPVGQGEFLIRREGGPTKEELSNENMLKIVQSECTDLEVNTLVWKALGYRFDNATKTWDATECFPNWREKYPTPPDLIGMQRMYSREIDQISLRSNQALVRSIPVDNKQSLKKHLKPLGWKGFQVSPYQPTQSNNPLHCRSQ